MSPRIFQLRFERLVVVEEVYRQRREAREEHQAWQHDGGLETVQLPIVPEVRVVFGTCRGPPLLLHTALLHTTIALYTTNL